MVMLQMCAPAVRAVPDSQHGPNCGQVPAHSGQGCWHEALHPACQPAGNHLQTGISMSNKTRDNIKDSCKL